jgi:hypothetical protein
MRIANLGQNMMIVNQLTISTRLTQIIVETFQTLVTDANDRRTIATYSHEQTDRWANDEQTNEPSQMTPTCFGGRYFVGIAPS